MRTKIFFDTEFTGLRQNTTLISIGLTSQDGHTFYAEITDYNPEQVDDWIRDNVINKLLYNDKKAGTINDDIKQYRIKTTLAGLRAPMCRWFAQFESVEIWADVLAYDWVLFCNIFGGAFSIPKNIYYIPFDLATLLKAQGIDPDNNRTEMLSTIGADTSGSNHHNALWDAIVCREIHDYLTTKESQK